MHATTILLLFALLVAVSAKGNGMDMRMSGMGMMDKGGSPGKQIGDGMSTGADEDLTRDHDRLGQQQRRFCHYHGGD